MTPKPAARFLSVKSNLMSKMLHEYFFDMQLFKNSEFGLVENQYLQLNINGCYMLCLKEIQPILLDRRDTKLYLRTETKSQKPLFLTFFLVKNSVFVEKNQFLVFCFKRLLSVSRMRV